MLSVNAKAPKTLQSSQHLQKKATKTVRRSFEKEVGSGEVFADVGPASWKAALAGASGGETSWRGPPVGRKAAGGAPRSRRSAARLCTRTKGALEFGEGDSCFLSKSLKTFFHEPSTVRARAHTHKHFLLGPSSQLVKSDCCVSHRLTESLLTARFNLLTPLLASWLTSMLAFRRGSF